MPLGRLVLIGVLCLGGAAGFWLALVQSGSLSSTDTGAASPVPQSRDAVASDDTTWVSRLTVWGDAIRITPDPREQIGATSCSDAGLIHDETLSLAKLPIKLYVSSTPPRRDTLPCTLKIRVDGAPVAGSPEGDEYGTNCNVARILMRVRLARRPALRVKASHWSNTAAI